MSNENNCPFCGASNPTNNSFCTTCGSNLEVKKPETTYQSEPIQAQYVTPQQYQPPYQQPYQQQPYYQQPTYYSPKYPIAENKFTPIVVISLILSIASIAIFSWIFWLTDFYWVDGIAFGLTILGIILSAVSRKDHKIVGIVGIILCVLSLLAQIFWYFLGLIGMFLLY